jgi:hypothetical protein
LSLSGDGYETLRLRRRRLKNFQVLFVFDDGGWKNSIFFWFSAAVAEIFHGFFLVLGGGGSGSAARLTPRFIPFLFQL